MKSRITWVCKNGDLAQTGFKFEPDIAEKMAIEGASEQNFWSWSAKQEFTVRIIDDGIGENEDDDALNIISAYVETRSKTQQVWKW